VNFKILMDSVEDYARQWAKREKENLVILSELVKSVRSLIQIRIKKNHKYFKVVFPVYGFRLTIFRSFGEPPVIT
jgi:DNA/RNA endonuclease G (NUC1)